MHPLLRIVLFHAYVVFFDDLEHNLVQMIYQKHDHCFYIMKDSSLSCEIFYT